MVGQVMLDQALLVQVKVVQAILGAINSAVDIETNASEGSILRARSAAIAVRFRLRAADT